MAIFSGQNPEIQFTPIPFRITSKHGQQSIIE